MSSSTKEILRSKQSPSPHTYPIYFRGYHSLDLENIPNHSTYKLCMLYFTQTSSSVQTNQSNPEGLLDDYLTSVLITIVQAVPSFVRSWPHKIIRKFMQISFCQSAESTFLLTVTDQVSVRLYGDRRNLNSFTNCTPTFSEGIYIAYCWLDWLAKTVR
jgi:hypothetical protein